MVHVSGLTDTVSFTWDIPGTYLVTATVSNVASAVTTTHEIVIDRPLLHIYPPVAVKP